MEEADHQLVFHARSAPPVVVSLSPFSPMPLTSSSSSRRLSSHFTPSRPVPSARRLAWVSLQGRIVDAEEASSAQAIGGCLSRDQTIAWELFSPIQRFLIVAVIGVATAQSKKNRLISHLKKSVQLRDEVLSSMQQKLDDLCEQLNSIKNAGAEGNASLNKNVASPPSNAFGCDKIEFIDCGCWHCDHHRNLFAGLMSSNSVVKLSGGDEVSHYKMPLVNEVEQDERRMSDLSDWASSVTSTADIQMNSYLIDQDILNLKRECEDKDVTIKELTTVLQSTNIAGSKRTAELEEIIRRKNTTITKLKRDIMVLEQKLVHFTRLQRPSFPSNSEGCQIPPFMMDNIIYDMDSNTSPSSSDSDSPSANRPQTTVIKNRVMPDQNRVITPPRSKSDSSHLDQRKAHVVQIQETPLLSTEVDPITNRKSAPAKVSSSLVRSSERHTGSRPPSPLKEISANQKKYLKEVSTNQKSSRLSSFRPKRLSAGGEIKKSRRHTQTVSSDAAPKKRWF